MIGPTSHTGQVSLKVVAGRKHSAVSVRDLGNAIGVLCFVEILLVEHVENMSAVNLYHMVLEEKAGQMSEGKDCVGCLHFVVEMLENKDYAKFG